MKNIIIRRRSIQLIIASLFLFSFSSLYAEIKGFEDFQGKPQVIENYIGKGKWTVVMVWASDCHICNKEAYQYVDFHLVHSEEDATVLGISVDGASRKKAAEGFIKKHSVDFPNLITEPDNMSQFYREHTGQSFVGTPTILVYSPDGKLQATDAGAVPTNIIEDFIQKNSVKKTANKS